MRSAISRPMRAMRTVVPLLIAAPLVAACGGGGGGGGGGALYDQWGLRTIKVDRAYERLETKYGTGTAPGSGQILGVIDSGMDADHPVFAGNLSWGIPLEGSTGETGDEPSHGTAVASVIMGRPSESYAEAVTAPRGVAWGADIAMFARSPWANGQFPETTSRNPLTALARDDASSGRRTIDRCDRLVPSGTRTLDFVNMSVGFNGIIEQYSAQQLRLNFGDTIAALVQAGVPEKDRSSSGPRATRTGSENPCDPSDFTGQPRSLRGGERRRIRSTRSRSRSLPGLPVRIPELRELLIAVVAVGRNGRIASFSNRCGIAAEWCLAAPGAGMRAAYFGPHPDDRSPGASGPHGFLRRNVLCRADGDRRAGGDEITISATSSPTRRWSRGCTRPPTRPASMPTARSTARVCSIWTRRRRRSASPAVVTGETVDGPGAVLARTRFAPGGALGDGLARALAGREIAAFDSLGAPFWFPLGASPAPLPAPRPPRGCGPSWRRGGIGRPESCGLATPR